MKKILVALGIFALGSILQLTMGTVYLFNDVAPLTQLCVLLSFLLVSTFGLSVLDQLEKMPKVTEGLTDTFRMLVFHCGRLASVLMVLGTLNVLAVAASYLYTIPFWVHASLLLGMVLVMIVSVVVVLLIVRAGRPKKVKDQPQDEPSQIISET